MGSGIATNRDFVLNGIDDKTDWHKQTIPLGRPLTINDVPETTVVPCEFEGKPLEIDGKAWSVLKSNDGLPLGKPFSGSFSVFDARQGYEWINEILAGTEFKIARHGMLWNRSKWFFAVELVELQALCDKGEKFVLNMANGLDGSLSRGAELAHFLAVCWNTVNLSRMTGKRLFNVKNTKNATVRMDAQREEIEKMVGMARLFKEAMNQAKNTSCQVQTAREIYAGAILESDAEITTAKRNTLEGLVSLFQRGDGNRGETVADVLNGFTQYGTRGFESSKKDLFTRIESSEFGGMADKKAEFARNVLAPDLREAMRDTGAKLLAMAN